MAFSIGGIIFAMVVLHPVRNGPGTVKGAISGVLRLVMAGAILIALCQLLLLLIGPWALADELGRWPLGAFLEGVVPLAVCTVLHQLGAIIWIGGVTHLVLLHRRMRGSAGFGEVWPILLERFSPLAILSVTVLAATGIYLAFKYIGSFGGFVGTAYGVMVLT